AGDDGRQGAPPRPARRGTIQARGGGHRRPQRPVNPIYWDLGDGLEVRTLTPDDAETSFALVDANRERLRPWMIWEPQTKSPDDTRSFIVRCLASETDIEGNGLWLDGRLAGGMGLRIDPGDEAAEIGYWIGGEFEGRGIVTRACRRFFDFAFDELG